MQEGCTVNLTVRYLSKKWMLLIILELYKGEAYTRRFSELRTSLDGITPKVLSERLRELEEEGLLTRRIDTSVFPVRSEYCLTESGLEIVDLIRDIKRWALKWKIDNIPCGEQDCKKCIL
ncbi:DNA-binding HxlR family transcriptional regulator [Methanocalculus alkaliphilus]|uniref:winged helix-turn-helix transcriptional regulator n=1 Tax=Methanocalculus alkaliphilus TaxID=768730 RepID=UPI00209F34BE|nr:helix-turn-helix domain-containing protein [Methanocalculus alkaliphilus]MCP1715967.1 DNA-binding HxlR family transcriptional regulator [Methanocalculus alkaliphilus]